VVGAVPLNSGQSVTLLGALGPRGWVAAMSVEGPTDAEVFLAFLREVLAPRVRAGDIVARDRLGAHRVAAVRPTLRAAGARLLDLPPYSPDLSPIEPCWAKVKEALRTAEARTPAALDQAISAAVARVTAADARGWFRHCGYALH
jgi:transposase